MSTSSFSPRMREKTMAFAGPKLRKERQHVPTDDLAGSHNQLEILVRRADPDPHVSGGVHAAHPNGQRRNKGNSAVVSELDVAERLERSGRSWRDRPGKRDGRRAVTVATKDAAETRAACQSRVEGDLTAVIEPDRSWERAPS